MRLSELKLYLKKGSKKQKALFNTLLRQNKYLDINIPEDSIKKLFPGLYSSEDDTIVYADPHPPRKRRRRTVSRAEQARQARALTRMIQPKQKPTTPQKIRKFLEMMSDPKLEKMSDPKRRKIERAEQQIVLPSTHASRGGRGGRKLTDYLNGLHDLPLKLQEKAKTLNSWQRRVLISDYFRKHAAGRGA